MTEGAILASEISWTDAFMLLASTCSLKSKDPSTKTGCVIADENNRIVSTGYNGFPTSVPDYASIWNSRDEAAVDLCKYDAVIHAEMNAILYARRDLYRCHIFCTHPTCLQCAKHIVAAGIKSVTCMNNLTVMDLKQTKVRQLFDLASVKYNILLTPKESKV